MSDQNEKVVQDLEAIIRLLANVWTSDKSDLPEAGAKFEEVVTGIGQNGRQLKRLVDLSWEGLKHLYQKDDFFMMVKAATMQAVNTIREYILNDGNIPVEVFEKSYEDLEKSLSGGAESADTVVDLDEEQIAEFETQVQQNTIGEVPATDKVEPEASVSLNDVAGYILTLDESSVTDEHRTRLLDMLKACVNAYSDIIATPLEQAIDQLERQGEEWFIPVSELLEQAINEEADEHWLNDEITDEAEETVEVEKSQKDIPEPVVQAEEPRKEEPVAQEQTGQPAQDTEDVFIIPDETDIDMIGEFVSECADLLEMAETSLLDLEERPGDNELINTVFRSFHTIKGTSAFMGFTPISEYTHSAETLLDMIREGELPFDQACADINLESIDIISKMMKTVEHAQIGDPLPKPAQYDSMLRVIHAICDDGAKPADALSKEQAEHTTPSEAEIIEQATERYEVQTVNAASEKGQNGSEVKEEKEVANILESVTKSDVESSVRVSVSRLDRVIDMVGELVIAHSVVAQDKTIAHDPELQKKVNHTTKILRELQDTSLTLRMVPMKATFNKMNRLVRDLSKKAGKVVKFSTVGEDTEIDRNMVDIINEPLIHMLRNALDHGVEGPDERVSNGKPGTANISLKASQEGGKVVIKIEDDGRGINKDVIFNKAVEKGLIEPDRKMTDKEIYNLIFLPGFSSAETVTDLSGRGVGMDVVKRSIEQLQGKVEILSELGKGTSFVIELPFTLAITDGMLVRVGAERFIVPTINIDMTFRAEQKDLFTVMGASEQVNFRGKSVPVIRLHRVFEINGAVENILDGTMLIIRNDNRKYALMVDEVIGQQQLVGKSINMIAKTDHISGGAILGDGRVGLILDTVALVEEAA
ncbi:MAG: chemotaxis protein CheA [Bacteroidota bacterium]